MSYLRRKRARERGLKGVAARRRKMGERADGAEEVGRIVFEGSMFGGKHVMRLLFCEDWSREKVMVEIDGKARGVLGLIAGRCVRPLSGRTGRTQGPPVLEIGDE